MPNLAAKIGKSPVILYGPDLAGKQRTAVTLLAEATGGAFWLAIEGQFDAATALAGCGPAFVYRFIDAVMEGGVSLGLDAGEAGRLALRMVEGAAILAGQSERSPGQLADLVASPGGMTRKGLDVLDNDDALAKLVGEALRSAAHHGATLAGKPPSKGA
jgi:pyrroline-5-carboxylate reductase